MILELSLIILAMFLIWIAYCIGYDQGHDAGYIKGIYRCKTEMLRKKVANISLTEFYEEMENLEKEHEQRI